MSFPIVHNKQKNGHRIFTLSSVDHRYYNIEGKDVDAQLFSRNKDKL